MSFNLSLPCVDGRQLEPPLGAGAVLFVLGPNGAGKSSLMHRLYVQNQEKSRRISAHRQTWFAADTITLSPAQKRQTEQNIRSIDKVLEARWLDHLSGDRPNLAIYDLLDAENVRARRIAAQVDGGDMEAAKAMARKDGPVAQINELFAAAALPIRISLGDSDRVLAARNAGPEYSIAQLSDGERNALLIAAEVLTAPAGTLLLIDEPERHLHRAIVSPLLTELFRTRPDCSFVISTHDVALPLDNAQAPVLLVRSCEYQGTTVTGWDADLVQDHASIDEEIKRDILGSRRTLLFVEGDAGSLDKPLYALVFPQASIVPKASCRDVEHAVRGIRDSHGLHWVRAFGIVDNDTRGAAAVAELKAKGVYALPVRTVESIYYHPEIQRRIALRSAQLDGTDPGARVTEATTEAIAAVRPHIQRLAERVAESDLRAQMMSKLPKRADVAARAPIEVTLDVASVVSSEVDRLTKACDDGDLAEIVGRYPVRETPALAAVATKLGFRSREHYEAAVRKLLYDDPDVLLFVRGLFADLVAALAAT